MSVTIREIAANQSEFQSHYAHKWGGYTPERTVRLLAWLYGELGEVGDIIKKKGSALIKTDDSVRTHFVEELCDVMMYWHDVFLCAGFSPEEAEKAYRLRIGTYLPDAQPQSEWEDALTLQEMQTMQIALEHESTILSGGKSPENGAMMLLTLYSVLGEVSAVLVKEGVDRLMKDESVRDLFLSKLCDVLLFWNAFLLCYDVTFQEVEAVYREKYARNMKRW